MGHLYTTCRFFTRIQPVLWIIAAGALGLASHAHGADDPFRIEGKPPANGYFTHTPDPVPEDLTDLTMISQVAGVFGKIEPRSYSTLRRAISKEPIAQGTLSDQSRIAYLHLSRGGTHIALEVHDLGSDIHVLRSAIDPTKTWGIASDAFDRVGIRWPISSDSETANAELKSDRVQFELAHPYVESDTLLDIRTIRARFKQSYPRLSRKLENENFRVRLPSNYNPGFPAGVLVWISPMPDGRIPQIFNSALDKHGIIAIGVDNNGNKRQLTDRLQNHLDSIESVASHYLIDRERIYLTGMSGGGRCSGILQFAFPDLFAGAVPIVGLDTYHNAPTGDPGKYWPARLGKPAGRWMRLLKERRIAGITGTADFNEPEMSIRQGMLENDGIKMRLDIIEGMAHTMPTSDQFADAFDWVDEPRRDAMIESFKEAKSLMSQYREEFGENHPSTPASRKMLISIIELAPWTDPAWEAAAILGYERQD